MLDAGGGLQEGTCFIAGWVFRLARQCSALTHGSGGARGEEPGWMQAGCCSLPGARHSSVTSRLPRPLGPLSSLHPRVEPQLSSCCHGHGAVPAAPCPRAPPAHAGDRQLHCALEPVPGPAVAPVSAAEVGVAQGRLAGGRESLPMVRFPETSGAGGHQGTPGSTMCACMREWAEVCGGPGRPWRTAGQFSCHIRGCMGQS